MVARRAAKKKGAGVASMNPDQMETAGLATDFDGTITQVRLVPWDYAGGIDHHVLAVRVTITPDEDSGFEEFTNHYSAGDLEQFVPSMDGEEPVDLDSDEEEEMEGVFALRVGKREQLNNSTNWAHFTRAAIDAGFDIEAGLEESEGSVECFEGVYGHFNQIPQQKRSGIVVEEDEDSRPRTLLVLTEVLEAAPKAAAKKTRGGATKKKAAATDDLDEELTAAILEALGEADEEEGIEKKALPKIIAASFKGAKKAKAVKRAGDVKFLGGSEEWDYDADEGILYLLEEE